MFLSVGSPSVTTPNKRTVRNPVSRPTSVSKTAEQVKHAKGSGDNKKWRWLKLAQTHVQRAARLRLSYYAVLISGRGDYYIEHNV